jgi:CRP/FNR family transcriptional regulator, nitrogen oxide reductase regulator
MAAFPSRPLDTQDTARVAEAKIFRGLDPTALAALSAAARKVSARKGQALVRQGDRADAVFLVLTGRLKVLEAGEDGREVLLRIEGQGALLGLIAALGVERYPVTAQVLEACTAARWSGKDLEALMRRHPAIALGSLPMVLARLRELQHQYRELATERVERRVARAVMRLVRQTGERTPEGVRIDVPLTRQELAEMTGTTLFTVSRILTQWTGEGILLSRGKRLVVRQPHALARLGEDFG